jgi:hypothetical protein
MTMRRIVARYIVKPGSEAGNAELVRAVYRQLAELRPQGFRYATYRLEDGRTFIHIAEQEDDGPSPLPALTAFQEFQAGIGDRCEWGPEVGYAPNLRTHPLAGVRHLSGGGPWNASAWFA